MASLPNLYPKFTEFNFYTMQDTTKRGRPEIISDYWYSIDWNVGELWNLDLPIVELPLVQLEWHLDVPVWPNEEGRPYAVTPRQVLEFPANHPTESERLRSASLAYPLEVFRNRGRLMILDGIHRLAKAHALGLEKIHVRHIPESAVRSTVH